ncbi:MAG: hypothetical protein ACJ8FY_11715 [Gemmataceae bacterium]
MPNSESLFSASIQNGLGFYYLFAVLLNLGFAAYYYYGEKKPGIALLWTLVGGLFLVHAGANFAHLGWHLTQGTLDFVDRVVGAESFFIAAVAAFTCLLLFRRTLTDPLIAWGIVNVSLLGAGWAMTNKDFREVVTKPDNVPITLLIYSVAFFTWLALRRGVINDERMDKGEAPLEKLEDDKVLVWPDLVYTELICMIICTFVLVIWGVALKAPLEPPATTAKAPNPSKAPWYFLGLQEMLVYFDPWMAGVVLPLMIIGGLICLPYVDFNQKGNGYFTFKQRMFAITTFMFGFDVLWVVLIVLGTFLRGPNWNFFGPFEYWDPHKVLPLNNINLSQIFWFKMGGDAGQMTNWFVRELPGLALVIAYLVLLPPLLAKTVMRPFFIKMGFTRFFILVTFLQFMAALPIKMVLRWTLNLKYIVFIPEYFFNI